MATRAFAGDPQPVEVHHRGIWYSGELLGWRHASDGRVSARVRCTVDGLRHSTWKDLAELRLPDPARPPRAEPFPAPGPRAVHTGTRRPAVGPRVYGDPTDAGWSSSVARWAHNPEVTGSNPVPATATRARSPR